MYLFSYYKYGVYYEEELNTKESKSDRNRSYMLQARYSNGSIQDLQVKKIETQLSINDLRS